MKALTKDEVTSMGAGLLALMSREQVQAAVEYHHSTDSVRKQYMVGLLHLNQAWKNHWQRVMRMPAGGAHAGGAMQTGFEMELISAYGIRMLLGHWPNHQTIRLGHSWELRTMEEVAKALNFSKWGLMNAKPIPAVSGSDVHAGLILAAPPVTATWRMRSDATTVLVVRCPIVIWSENNATILPPDDAMGVPFYVDPEDRPGFHRDLFQGWARRVLGEFAVHGYPMSPLALTHLPQEYQSGESSDEEPTS